MQNAWNIWWIRESLAFVGTGLTAFWLAYFVSRSYIGSLPAGFAFTFSNLGVVALVCLVVAGSRGHYRAEAAPWLIVAGLFAVLSVGPRMHVMGNEIESIPMPYTAAAWAFPVLDLGGVPVRMMIMTLLASSVVIAIVLGKIRHRERTGAVLLTGAALLVVLESWPAELPLTETT